MENVVKVGKLPYQNRSGIHRMYTNWTSDENGTVPEGRGPQVLLT